MMVDRMCGGNHFASDDLKQQIAKLIGRWTHYQEMASWRKELLEKALSFHRTESKVGGSEGVGVEGVDVEGVGVEGVDVEGVGVEGVDVEGVDVEGVGVEGVGVRVWE